MEINSSEEESLTQMDEAIYKSDKFYYYGIMKLR